MEKPIKRVAAIHDLSGFGKASLTTIIPILSTMKVQVCPVPTAILSTHTGGFKEYSFVDLTDTMEDYMNHWRKLKIDFDCIYTGFLGSSRQIEIVSSFIDSFGNHSNLTVVDPVMGDNGKLYDTMDEKMVSEMRKLIKKADIITPNFTEAALLLDKQFCRNIENKDIKKWLVELSNLGPNIVIITSVPDNDVNKNVNTVAFDKINNVFWKATSKKIPAFYPGTGDSFTSVIIGSLLQGDSLPMALDRAVQFITQCIKVSYGFNYPNREGVLIEKVLDNLKMPLVVSSCEIFE